MLNVAVQSKAGNLGVSAEASVDVVIRKLHPLVHLGQAASMHLLDQVATAAALGADSVAEAAVSAEASVEAIVDLAILGQALVIKVVVTDSEDKLHQMHPQAQGVAVVVVIEEVMADLTVILGGQQEVIRNR